MPSKRRKFRRQLGERRYRKLIVIAVEGTKTELQYFSVLRDQQSVVQVKCIRSKHGTSPPQVLKRMKIYLQKEKIKSSDEAWIVTDKDQWTDEQLGLLYDWSQVRNNYGFALSNPKFEYWLLLHFEDGTDITSSRSCGNRLKEHLPSYDKQIDESKFTLERINAAIHRAKLRDNPPCNDWPRNFGSTTVYRLIEKIIQV